MSLISVKDNAGSPKYKQIISSIENALLLGTIKKGDKMPSINSIRNKFSLSRDTVLKAYNELKVRGIVKSIVGKGYYINSENVEIKQKFFLLFDELNTFKEDLYNSFLNSLNSNTQVDIFFHHFNFNVFSKLISGHVGDYHTYIIMPANLRNTAKVIDKLPLENVYILDQIHPELSQYAAIYQNFEKDIYNNLTLCLPSINKYKNLIFLFQEEKQPPAMLKGFTEFCSINSIKNKVLRSIDNSTPKKGEIYMIPDDRNLILLIKKLKKTNLAISQDVGIISYNDTLLKQIVEGGITTISTDFEAMGKRLAQMVSKKEKIKIENPSGLILRNSL